MIEYMLSLLPLSFFHTLGHMVNIDEMCALIRLEEFHVAGNQLTSLPLEFGFLVNLEKLYLQKNKIRELPEVFEYLFLFI
jgi:Leucine-rich repeat (LRR) protein